ncbi:MAG: ABC-F family ATP-binding cassette domain-containing protein [Chitinispirillaceae bacterium]|nr:ABC-F family ATP-binding cassette domain-containing protein [Chitinispirillaceae bacterium]
MITFDNVCKHYGGETLFDGVSAAFHDDGRTGLIGVNGSGKTTLLRMLAGEETPGKGSISKPADLTMGYLHQEVEVFAEKTPLEIVLEPFAHLLDFEERLSRLGAEAGGAGGQKKTLRQIAELHGAVEHHDAYTLEPRAKAILAGLGVPEERWEQPLATLSGGYRMRVALGKLLLLSPSFLLLDEPTNHLDMDSLVWLEKFLQKYNGGMVIVSHDRDFLNRMTGYTAEIHNRNITVSKGNYDAYLEVREQTRTAVRSRARHLQEQIAQKERFVERFKAKNTKAVQAAAKLKQIEKLKGMVPEIEEAPDTIVFSFPEAARSGGVPLKARDLAMSYGATPVFSGLSLEIRRGDRAAVVGPNGAGKTTLLKIMAGLLVPTAGSFEPGYNTAIRYFSQYQLEQLDGARTAYETVAAMSVSAERTFIRNLLGAFLFSGDDVDKPVRVLSGGEKSRLVLATILANPGNTLLLDEPTNHLDINSVETLLRALTAFKGTIVLVSHDDYFVSKIATRVIEMRPGLIRDFPGTLADYRAYVEQGLWGMTAHEQTDGGRRSGEYAESKEERTREREERRKLQRSIEKLEREIESCETDIERLKKKLDDPANASNHELLFETSQTVEMEQAELNDRLREWERLRGELEGMNK